jgi:hypothetical protein
MMPFVGRMIQKGVPAYMVAVGFLLLYLPFMMCQCSDPDTGRTHVLAVDFKGWGLDYFLFLSITLSLQIYDEAVRRIIWYCNYNKHLLPDLHSVDLISNLDGSNFEVRIMLLQKRV